MSGSSLRDLPPPERCVAICTMWFFWVLFTLFLFLQPLLSDALNDGVPGVIEPGWKAFCNTPADQISCGSGENYTDIAISLNRTTDGIHYWGCGCGEGLMGDHACMVNLPQNVAENKSDGFSVSYFIGTPPATGAMSFFSSIPILSMWFYGTGDTEWLIDGGTNSIVQKANMLSLFVFQVCYGLFLVFTFCYQETLHFLAVGMFILSLAVHFLIIAGVLFWYGPGLGPSATWTKAPGRTIFGLCTLGVVSLAFGVLTPVSASWLGQHAFWLGECIGLSSGCLIAPVCITLSSTDAKAEEEQSLKQEVPTENA